LGRNKGLVVVPRVHGLRRFTAPHSYDKMARRASE
jgi:hypothetical protein